MSGDQSFNGQSLTRARKLAAVTVAAALTFAVVAGSTGTDQGPHTAQVPSVKPATGANDRVDKRGTPPFSIKPAKAHQPEESHDRAANHPRKAVPAKHSDSLDGWIREALAIMKNRHIRGSYEGIHRNIIRESGGNPRAINNWDTNAKNGVPSKGLLQVIQPTFNTYHVSGTSRELYDPVANITAACNYAAHRYGSIDNVNSAY